MPFQCSVCTDAPRRAWVAERVHEGTSAYRIEQLSRLPDAAERGVRPIKYETLLRHIRHMKERPETMFDGTAIVMEAVPSKVLPPKPRSPGERKGKPPVVTEFTPGGPVDIATIVQKRAAEGIERGELLVTTAHGLQAQKMIDTREDKRKDRELAVNIARLLSGATGVPQRLIVRDVTPQEVPEDYVPSLPSLTGDPS